MRTILEVLKLATDYLARHKIENPRLNAEILLADVLNFKRYQLFTNFDKPLKDEELEKFKNFLIRRVSGEPVQYITSKANFYGFEFYITKDVLIPRPETELLVEEVLLGIREDEGLNILDICSGSGVIGLILAKFLPDSRVYLIDLSDKAIEISRINANRLDIRNVVFLNLDILKDDIPDIPFNIIVSNPPYVNSMKKDSVQKEIKLHEPEIAIFVDDELKFYTRIIELAKKKLVPNGMLFFEIDDQLAESVQFLMEQNDFNRIIVKKDYAGLNRIIYGVKK